MVIDASSTRSLAAGRVYFLNIQKLGKEKDLVTPGDKRTFTIWETITNTVDAQPASFFVIIDEAHRGMTEDASGKRGDDDRSEVHQGLAGENPAGPAGRRHLGDARALHRSRRRTRQDRFVP